MLHLSAYLDSYASCVNISLDRKSWHTEAKIPNEPGWYFIRTNTPLTILCQQNLWATTYVTSRAGNTERVKNYDIAARANRYDNDLSNFWNLTEVYSGMASRLRDRAREHTFPDPGTAALALSKYPVLQSYDWLFGYITLNRFSSVASCPEMLLRLGEQMWRAKNGWPLLCAE
jgi:hypothetical protein